MEWQPIETAPKDGVWIQLWREPEGRYSCIDSEPLIFARWSEVVDAFAWPDEIYDPFTSWGLDMANAMVDDGRYFYSSEFTHWMPLPKAPNE